MKYCNTIQQGGNITESVQATTAWLLAAEIQIQSWVTLSENDSGRSGTGADFSPSSVFHS
jgi:hypothetical protein